jgi:hypothetical protein
MPILHRLEYRLWNGQVTLGGSMKKLILLFAILAASCAGQPPIESDLKRDWLSLRNSTFHVLTYTREDKAVAMLQELERFRVVCDYFLSPSITEMNSPITLVLFNGFRAMQKYEPDRNLAGWIVETAPSPMGVLAAKFLGADYELEVLYIIYADLVLQQDDYRYPDWYIMGLAHLLSATEIKGDEVIVGGIPDRLADYTSRYPRKIPFNEFIAEEVETSKSNFGGTNYLMWGAVHFLVFNEEWRPKLDEYLHLYNAGESSQSAFETAFGMSAEQLWTKEVEPYLRRGRIMARKFSPDWTQLDDRITVEDANSLDVFAALNLLRDYQLSERSEDS